MSQKQNLNFPGFLKKKWFKKIFFKNKKKDLIFQKILIVFVWEMAI